MADDKDAILVNLVNVEKVWGKQSKQFKEALRTSGLSRSDFETSTKKAGMKEKSTEQKDATFASPLASSGAVVDLSRTLHNLVIRTKPK